MIIFNQKEKQKIQSDIERQGFSLISAFWELDKLRKLEKQLDFLINEYINKISQNKNGKDKCSTLSKYYPESLGEIYDLIAYSDTFLNLISGDLADIVRIALDLPIEKPLYSWQHRILMQLPFCNKRLSNWHQEIFYTIPFSTKFLQCWFPLFEDANENNGSIWILPKSHKEGYALSKVNYPKDRIMQITVDNSVVEKYQPIQMNVKRGDLIIFEGSLIHKSGKNKSDKTRFSIVGMFHDLSASDKISIPKPEYKYRGISPLDWHKNVFSSESLD